VIVDKVSYRWTFRNLHNRVGFGEETESGRQFSENRIFWTEFLGRKFELEIGEMILRQHPYL